jgi:hypothetical protein
LHFSAPFGDYLSWILHGVRRTFYRDRALGKQ